jgi:Flp pilus assembly protein TadG
MRTFDWEGRGRERGQVVVIFALALVMLLAMVGLVLDGGSVFAQRRVQQNAADLAALAGANDYLLNSDPAAAFARARGVASQNGYTDGTSGVTVNVNLATSNGARVQVDITAPHSNTFARVIPGQESWQVSTTATAKTGIPDTVQGAAPFIFSIEAFGTNGQPLGPYGNPASPFAFGGCGDNPANATEFAWTNYGTGNVDTNEVESIIAGTLVINKTIQFGQYIGQHNQGCHAALVQTNSPQRHAVDPDLLGQNVPVPVVDTNGNFQGWATFHVSGADKNTKEIIGYFVSPFLNDQLTVGTCSAGSCPRYLGSWSLGLVN